MSRKMGPFKCIGFEFVSKEEREELKFSESTVKVVMDFGNTPVRIDIGTAAMFESLPELVTLVSDYRRHLKMHMQGLSFDVFEQDSIKAIDAILSRIWGESINASV